MEIDLIINLRYQLSKRFKSKNREKTKEIYFLLDKLENSIKVFIRNQD